MGLNLRAEDPSYDRRFTSAESAREYDEVVYHPGSYDTFLWEQERHILTRVVREWSNARQQRTRYLDFACGTGRVLAHLEGVVDHAVGVDVSEAMIARARARVRKAHVVQADITVDDMLLPGPFDLVTAFRFFLNAEPSLRAAALQALHQRLTDDGLLILNLHGNGWSLRGLSAATKRLLRQEKLNQMRPPELWRLLQSHGFEIVEWHGVGALTSRLHDWLGPWLSSALSTIVGAVWPLKLFAVDLVVVCRKELRKDSVGPTRAPDERSVGV